MRNDKTATPETAALPDFPWMTTLPEILAWPLRMQDVLWRAALMSMARMAELRADCLRGMASAMLPMDAAAIQGSYARKLLNAAEEEGSRLIQAMKDARPVLRHAA